MNTFVWSRFTRVFRNDLQQQWRKIWISTLGFAGVALIIYLTNVDPRQNFEPELYIVLFPVALLGGGLVFTCALFSDMHHPLQRFQYLTMPCSNLERFLSRYLLSAPLLYLYVLATYAVFDWVAAGLSLAMMDTRAMPFAPFTEPVVRWLTLAYFFLHTVALTGAIYFRSYHLIKTVLACFLIATGLGIVQVLSLKVVFFDYFPSVFSLAADIPMQPLFIDQPGVYLGFLLLLHLWILYVAFRCLCDHEVQDEL